MRRYMVRDTYGLQNLDRVAQFLRISEESILFFKIKKILVA